MSKLFFLLALTLIFVSYTMQQNAQFLAFTDRSVAKSRVLKEANKVLINFNYASHLNTSDVWEYRDKGTFIDYYIHLKDFAVKGVTYDLSSTSTVIGAEGITINGTNQISVTYSFSYNAKTAIASSTSGVGEFTVHKLINSS